MEIKELERICMEMIGYAGEGKAQLNESMNLFDEGNLTKSKELLEQAEKNLNLAHEIQFKKLMAKQSDGEKIPFHLLLIHAMDILADSTVQLDMFKRKLMKNVE